MNLWIIVVLGCISLLGLMPPKEGTRGSLKDIGVKLSWDKKLGGGIVREVIAADSTEEEEGRQPREPSPEWDHSADRESPLKDDTPDLDDLLQAGSLGSLEVRRGSTDVDEVALERIPRSHRIFGVAGDTDISSDTSGEEFQFASDRMREEVVPVQDKMDEATYVSRSRILSDQLRKVEDAITDFTIDDVVPGDFESHIEPLGKASDEFNSFRNGLRSFYGEFDREAHEDWESSWEGKLAALKLKLKTNENRRRLRRYKTMFYRSKNHVLKLKACFFSWSRLV